MENINVIYDYLKAHMPLELCESWDNSGLLIKAEENIKKALVTLDVTDAVIDEAILNGCQLIISHHPIIFKPAKNFNNNDLVFKLIRNNISVISMHTNLDAADNGVNDIFAKIIGVEGVEYFSDIGRKGYLKNKITTKEFAESISKYLNTPVKYTLPDKKIVRVALIGGSAGGYWKDALKEGCDVFVTGEASHHDACDSIHANIALIIAGHWNTERPIVYHLANRLSNDIKNVEFLISTTDKDPFEYLNERGL